MAIGRGAEEPLSAVFYITHPLGEGVVERSKSLVSCQAENTAQNLTPAAQLLAAQRRLRHKQTTADLLLTEGPVRG